MLSPISVAFCQFSELASSGNRSKVRAIILSLAILASPTVAADFRGSELGGPCGSISEHELALGSKELGDPSLVNQHRFSGHAFYRDLYITYLCKDGLLAIGDLHTALHVYDDAVSDFDAVYSGLTAMYGAPYYEHSSDPKKLDDTQFPRVGGEPREYQAAWRGKGFHANLALHTQKDRTGPNWVVVVVFAPELTPHPR
jgi:hypothetical protein